MRTKLEGPHPDLLLGGGRAAPAAPRANLWTADSPLVIAVLLLVAFLEVCTIVYVEYGLNYPAQPTAIILPLCPSSVPEKPGDQRGGPWLVCKSVFHQQDV